MVEKTHKIHTHFMVNETQQNNGKAKKCSQEKLNCITIYSTTEKIHIKLLKTTNEMRQQKLKNR